MSENTRDVLIYCAYVAVIALVFFAVFDLPGAIEACPQVRP